MCTSKTHRVRRKKKEKSEMALPCDQALGWAGRTEPPACGLRLEWRMDCTESVDGDEGVRQGRDPMGGIRCLHSIAVDRAGPGD